MQPTDLQLDSAVPRRLFVERTASAWADITRDDYGFIKPSQRFFPYDRLLNQPCVLVVAPPWTGKTTTARRIEESLKSRSTAEAVQFVRLLNLEARLHGQPLTPGWWENWKSSSAPAWWLIDSLEEGQRRDRGLCPSLLELLSGLSPEQRSRLRLALFARQTDLREVAKDFEKELAEIYQDDFLVVELLPLDRDSARELVEKHNGDFDRVLTLIKDNSLQSVAAVPAALRHLAQQPLDAELSQAEVWRGILEQLLKEHGSYKQTPFQTEIEQRFAAAQRLAVALTLSGFDEFGDLPRWTDVILDPASRPAAREALRSGMFHATATGHRFLHRNVREWMAAFGLAKIPLEKLRPVLQGVPRSGDEQAFILPEFNDLAQLLLLIVGDSAPRVTKWLRGSIESRPSDLDLFVPDLPHVQQVLDRLERLASRGGFPDWLEDPQSVRLLVVEGIEAELASRLSDTESPTDSRRVILRLGTVLELEKVLRLAASIVRDPSEDQELRSWCASAVRGTSRSKILRSLEDFIETAEPQTRSEKAMVSTLISALVENGLWDTAKAFRFMPQAAASEVIDSTRILPRVLERHMTVQDADAIVSSLDASEIERLNEVEEKRWLEGKQLEREPRWEVYASAARKLTGAELADRDRVCALIPFALTLSVHTRHENYELLTTLAEGFRRSASARRKLFEAIVAAEKTSQAKRRRGWWRLRHLLTLDDLRWLLDQLPGLGKDLNEVWSVALHLSEQTSDVRAKAEVEEVVRTHSPETLSQYRELVQHQNEWEGQREQTSAKEEAPKRHIEQLNLDLLQASDLAKQQLLWSLSRVNFSPEEMRPRELVGRWSDLQPDLQRRVLDVCAEALSTIEPTPIPEGKSFPGSLQFEAQAFVALLRERPDQFELTDDRIRRWLPTVLATFHREEYEVLEDCFRAAPQTTEGILLEAISRELRRGDAYSILLQKLPPSLWTDNVTRWVARGVAGDQPAPARPHLLDFLALRQPAMSISVAGSVLHGMSAADVLRINSAGLAFGEPNRLGVKALEVLLALAPDEAWSLFLDASQLAPMRLLENLKGLTISPGEGLRIEWPSWPPDKLVSLAKLIFTTYPPEKDPPFTGGLVTSAHDYQRLRSNVLVHLTRSHSTTAPDAIAEAKAIHPRAKELIERVQARDAASSLLSDIAAPGGAGIPVADACRLLDDEHFRLIRTADDLLEVVVEELGELKKDVEYDLAMLYHPTAKGDVEKRRREEALQAYVLRRLSDRLPGKVLDRETQIKRKRRTDVRVIAPLLGTDQSATTVIEVKWSDNSGAKRGVSTGLTEQLSKDYLLNEGLSHGVFLVGWTGKLGTWKRTAGPRPKDKTAQDLLDALQRQADEFRSKHQGLDIRPVVWDLQP